MHKSHGLFHQVKSTVRGSQGQRDRGNETVKIRYKLVEGPSYLNLGACSVHVTCSLLRPHWPSPWWCGYNGQSWGLSKKVPQTEGAWVESTLAVLGGLGDRSTWPSAVAHLWSACCTAMDAAFLVRRIFEDRLGSPTDGWFKTSFESSRISCILRVSPIFGAVGIWVHCEYHIFSFFPLDAQHTHSLLCLKLPWLKGY